MSSKSSLAIALSKLLKFEKPKLKSEQYSTDSENAAVILWDAFLRGDINGKKIADLGAGTGILGIGALLLGAKKVFFVEKDKEVIPILKENLKDHKNFKILNDDINSFNEKVDTVIQNPPFGTKEKHADKAFLEKAFSISKIIYSIHKASTDRFVRKISEDNGFAVSNVIPLELILWNTQKFHKKKIHRINASRYLLAKT